VTCDGRLDNAYTTAACLAGCVCDDLSCSTNIHSFIHSFIIRICFCMYKEINLKKYI
jgi:hypothetical protein